MKKFVSSLILAILTIGLYGRNNETACHNLYSKVTYALAHTKNAMKATNFEHQTYYAERALIAIKKSTL